ncbi:hypothetical protein L7F22_060763 [Adiantum nelumboides]|nr:hypothetical protein [Adiantum nelumboides]
MAPKKSTKGCEKSISTPPSRSNTRSSSTMTEPLPPTQTESHEMEVPHDNAQTQEIRVSEPVTEKNRMDEYPILNKFCYTAKELHEEYGLNLEEKPPFVDDYRLLFHKVYHGPPSSGDITAKFARCYAFEKFHIAKRYPARHEIAWARFGENVLRMCSSKPGGLDKKVENWTRTNGAFHGGLLGSNKKRQYTQDASNMCNIKEDKIANFSTARLYNACGCSNIVGDSKGGYRFTYQGQTAAAYNQANCTGVAQTCFTSSIAGCSSFGRQSFFIQC